MGGGGGGLFWGGRAGGGRFSTKGSTFHPCLDSFYISNLTSDYSASRQVYVLTPRRPVKWTVNILVPTLRLLYLSPYIAH